MTFENTNFSFDVGDILNISDGTYAEKYVAIRRNGRTCNSCPLYSGVECPIKKHCTDTIFANALISKRN